MVAPGIQYLEVEAPKAGGESLRADIVGLGGIFRRGPLFTPTRVEDWGDQRAVFGGFWPLDDRGRHAFGPLAMYGFFANGGGSAIVVRMGARSSRVATGVLTDPSSGFLVAVAASSAGAWANGLSLKIPLKVLRRHTFPEIPSPEADAALRAGDLVRIRRDGAIRFGRVVEQSGNKLPWPIGPVPASTNLKVEVLSPDVEVIVEAPERTERHVRLSLRSEAQNYLWRALSAPRLESNWTPPIPREWWPLASDDPLYLALSMQPAAASEWVRTVPSSQILDHWPPALPTFPLPWGMAPPPFTPPWPNTNTGRGEGGGLLTLALAGGADDTGAINASAAREVIRILAVHPEPSVVAIPDLMLPSAPIAELCAREPLPDVPQQPPPDDRPECENAPLDPWPCDPPPVPVPPVEYPPGLPVDPPLVVPLPNFGDILVLQAELLRSISSDRTTAASGDTAGDRIALLDSAPGLSPERAVIEANRLRAEADTAAPFGGLLYPWLRILDPSVEARRTILVPPSGHLAGIVAKTTREGTPGSRFANHVLSGVIAVERPLTDEHRAILNEAHLIAMHSLPGRGTVAFGSRTLLIPEFGEGTRPDRFLPASRVVAYVRRALRALGSTLVFEPNDQHLWLRIRLCVEAILSDLYRGNVLAGRTPAEAYQVICGPETNPQEEIDQGRVTAIVSIAPALPAEFITIRIAFSRDEAAILEDFDGARR